MWNGRKRRPLGHLQLRYLEITLFSQKNKLSSVLFSHVWNPLYLLFLHQCLTLVSVLHAHTWTLLYRASCCSVKTARVVKGTSICIHLRDLLSDFIVLFTIQFSSDRWCVPVCVHCFLRRISEFSYWNLWPSKLAQKQMLMIFILEVPRSDVGRNNGFPDMFSMIFFSSRQVSVLYLRFGHGRFLLHPFSFD